MGWNYIHQKEARLNQLWKSMSLREQEYIEETMDIHWDTLNAQSKEFIIRKFIAYQRNVNLESRYREEQRFKETQLRKNREELRKIQHSIENFLTKVTDAQDQKISDAKELKEVLDKYLEIEYTDGPPELPIAQHIENEPTKASLEEVKPLLPVSTHSETCPYKGTDFHVINVQQFPDGKEVRQCRLAAEANQRHPVLNRLADFPLKSNLVWHFSKEVLKKGGCPEWENISKIDLENRTCRFIRGDKEHSNDF